MTAKTAYQKGVLIVNDGSEAEDCVWRRLALVGARPVEVIGQEELVESLLRTADIRECIAQADTLVVPQTAGTRVLQAVQKVERPLVEGKNIVEVSPQRFLNTNRGMCDVLINDEDRCLLRGIPDGSRVVILDDVASTYTTAARLAMSMSQVRCDLVTLLAANPKAADIPRLVQSGLSSVRSAVVTQYRKLADWRPAITTTGGIFDDTEKSRNSFENLCRYVRNEGLALRILAERFRLRDMGLLFLDLDGTSLIDGTMPPVMQEALQTSRRALFSVVATARSQLEYAKLPKDVRSLFRAGILDDGLMCSVNGSMQPALERKVNEAELRKLLFRSAREANAEVRIMSEGKMLPWKVRIRDFGGDLSSADYMDADTQTALRLAEAFNAKSQKFVLQPSGYGDATVVWPGSGKGTTGINALARTIPTLPSLSRAISAGDGPNDVSMFERIQKAGGTALAVNTTNAVVRGAASGVTDTQGLAEFLSRYSS